MSDVILRPYQEELIRNITTVWQESNRVLLQLPTGAGKTEIAIAIIKHSGVSTWLVVHRSELLAQVSDFLTVHNIEHGFIAAGHDYDPRVNVHLCMIQTLARRNLSRYDRPDLIIADEAHHSSSASFDALFEINAKVLGLTATPKRLDGKPLSNRYEQLVQGPSIRELIEQGFLAKPEVYIPSKTAQLVADNRNKWRVTAGDYNHKYIEQFFADNQKAIYGDVIEHYQDLVGNKPTIVFCPSVKQLYETAQLFNDNGIAAAGIDGLLTDIERKDIITRFKSGDIKCLMSCDLISEGFNMPDAEAAIMLRPTKSLTVYLQQCLDNQTEILTQNGWKQHGAIKQGDLVAGMNLQTEIFQYSPVIETIERCLGTETMYGISAGHLNLRVTAGHNMVYKHRNNINWHMAAAEDLTKHASTSLIPTAAKSGNKRLHITNNELRFLGLFLSDGTIGNKQQRLYISQSINSPVLDEIRNVLKKCNFDFKEYKISRKNQYADLVQFYVPKGSTGRRRGWHSLRRFIQSQKQLNAYQGLSDKQFGEVLYGLNLGDGCKSKTSWVRRTYQIALGADKEWAEHLQRLCISHGFHCSLKSTAPYGTNWWYANIRKNQSAVNLGGQKEWKNKLNIVRTLLKPVSADPNELVWCVTTELGNIFIRRKGKIAVVGNCGRVLRTTNTKDSCKIIDHVNNTQYFGPPWIQRYWSLNDYNKRTKTDSLTGVNLKLCLKCGNYCRQNVIICPICGNPFRSKSKAIQVIHDQLQKITIESAQQLVKDTIDNIIRKEKYKMSRPKTEQEWIKYAHDILDPRGKGSGADAWGKKLHKQALEDDKIFFNGTEDELRDMFVRQKRQGDARQMAKDTIAKREQLQKDKTANNTVNVFENGSVDDIVAHIKANRPDIQAKCPDLVAYAHGVIRNRLAVVLEHGTEEQRTAAQVLVDPRDKYEQMVAFAKSGKLTPRDETAPREYTDEEAHSFAQAVVKKQNKDILEDGTRDEVLEVARKMHIPEERHAKWADSVMANRK